MNSSDAHKLLQQGRTDEAERAAQQVLSRMPHDVEALAVLGLVALRRKDTGLAQRWLERAVEADPRHAAGYHYLGRVHDAVGDVPAAVAAHRKAIELAPDMFLARLHLAVALEASGANDEAVVQYSRALQDAQARGRWLNPDTTAPAVRPMVERAVAFVRRGRREAMARLVEPLQAKYGVDSMRRIEQTVRVYLHEEAPIYGDPRQRPTFLYMPGLPAQPYLDRELFPWIGALEADTDGIRAELMNLLPSAAGRERVFASEALEQQNLRGAGTAPTWNGYYFYRHGERREDNCAACPITALALDRVPLSHVREHGPEVLFSVFTPGTHLLPHRGVTNTRLVGHLPLIVPPDCALVVGGEQHDWREGQVVVFDDTYEHEAWNRSSQVRVVMIFDTWNPHLTEAERAALEDLIPAIGEFRQAVEAA
jgi:aspartate beta-hydroxylase